jgi:diguanylate cyclase (GGDEF)-like protein
MNIKKFFKAIWIVYKEGAGSVYEDKLTGLFNRRFFDQIVPKMVEAKQPGWSERRSRRQPVSVVLFDIDKFKQINDVHGHPAGDRVLKNVGDIIRSVIRKSDFAFRWGGDEFLLLLPQTGSRGAGQLIRRIAGKLREQGISISHGAALWNERKFSSLEEFLEEIDWRMYRQKRKKAREQPGKAL